MKLFLLAVIGYLINCSFSIQAIHQQLQDDSDRFFAVITRILEINGVGWSRQIEHCFTDGQKDRIWGLLVNVTVTGLQAGTTQLQNLPAYYQQVTTQNISELSLSCFYSSRDFQLYFSTYDTDISTFADRWTQKIGESYLIVHNQFVKMKENIDNSLDKDLGQTIDRLFKFVFGVKEWRQPEFSKTVRNFDNFTKKNHTYYGVSVSNGVIGAVSTMRPLHVATTVLAGAYDIFGRGRVNNIIQTFPALQMQIQYGSQITAWGYSNLHQELKMDEGQFKGAFSSQYCSVEYKYMALKNLPFAFYTSIDITAHSSREIVLKLKHAVPDYLNNIQKQFETIDSYIKFDIMHTKATTKSGKLDLIIASSFIIPPGSSFVLLHEDWDSQLHFLKLKMNVTKGKQYHFGVVSSLISSVHHQDPQNQAIRIVQRAISIGEAKLVQGHRKLWSQLWKNDIVIEGNEEDQKNVRLMLYHSYAFINDWKSYGISPMGLSGLGYNGHVFWDMDLWIYPGILALKPSLAKTLIEYRCQRLKQAKNNAFINGYKGAMFPWQSSAVGYEQTPIWALTGPLEHHVSGCVAFAAWNYYCVTQDKEWLREKGYQIIRQVADFWVSRVEEGDDGMYHINNVVAADQWAENVDDNAFTNAIAIQTLKIANKAAKVLGLPQNPEYSDKSGKIVILAMEDGVTKQHRTYHGENIKQADVNLLSFPLKTITDGWQIKKDLSYYEERVPSQGTPAMTYSIFTILYSRLNDSVNAYKNFKESFADNLREPFNVFAETKDGNNPYFMTGAGGVIQSMVFGFGGYDITQNGLVKIQTAIPVEWKSVTIKGFMKRGKQ